MNPSRFLPVLSLLLIFFGSGERVLHGQVNGVLREVYNNIPGVSVSDLTSNPAFPANPSAVEYLTSGGRMVEPLDQP